VYTNSSEVKAGEKKEKNSTLTYQVKTEPKKLASSIFLGKKRTIIWGQDNEKKISTLLFT